MATAYTISSGFYNSLVDSAGYGDRRYTANDLSYFFQGIISDGIYTGYDDAFVVSAVEDQLQVTVGTGKGYFNGRWVQISGGAVTLELASTTSQIGTRIDAVALVVDNSNRQATVEVITGTASSGTPVAPTLTDTTTLFYHTLAQVTVDASATSVTGNITDRRGLDVDTYGNTATPWAESALNTVDPTTLVNSLTAKLTTYLIPQLQLEIAQAHAAASSQTAQYFQPYDIHIKDVEIETTDWTEETSPTYSDYPYKYEIIPENTAIYGNETPYVFFSYDDYKTGIFCPFSRTEPGKIIVYASDVPTAKTVIDHIVVTKLVTPSTT